MTTKEVRHVSPPRWIGDWGLGIGGSMVLSERPSLLTPHSSLPHPPFHVDRGLGIGHWGLGVRWFCPNVPHSLLIIPHPPFQALAGDVSFPTGPPFSRSFPTD